MAQYQLRALRSDLKTFFGLHLHLAEKCFENLQSARVPARPKSGPAITWFFSVTIYRTIFQQQFINSLPPRQFLRTKYFLKNENMKNAD